MYMYNSIFISKHKLTLQLKRSHIHKLIVYIHTLAALIASSLLALVIHMLFTHWTSRCVLAFMPDEWA